MNTSPSNPTFVRHALETLRICPYAAAIVALLALFTLRAPLAPVGLLLAFFCMALLSIGLFLLSLRRRSTALGLIQYVVVVTSTGPIVQSFGPLPFGTRAQAICVFGLTVFGCLWFFRRAVVRFCHLEMREGLPD